MNSRTHTVEQLLEMGKDRLREHKEQYIVCGNAFRDTLFYLEALKAHMSNAQTQKKNTINLPEPTSEMLYALRNGDHIKLEYYIQGDIEYNAKTYNAALNRYNNLKEILSRPPTKTVTIYVVSWQYNGAPSSTTYHSADQAKRREDGLKAVSSVKHTSVTEVQQTIDDV